MAMAFLSGSRGPVPPITHCLKTIVSHIFSVFYLFKVGKGKSNPSYSVLFGSGSLSCVLYLTASFNNSGDSLFVHSSRKINYLSQLFSG